MNTGTPPDLRTALVRKLSGSVTLLMTFEEAENLADELLPVIQDRLSQDFGVSMFQCETKREVAILEDLFKKIFPRSRMRSCA